MHQQRLLLNLECERKDLAVTKTRLESALRTNRKKQRVVANALADLDRANSELTAAQVRLDRQATELVRTNGELMRAKVKADAANRSKGEFLARVSHEIRTPLTSVIAASELLLEEELTPEHQEMFIIMRSAALHLVELVSDILDFSKIERGDCVL